MNSIPSLSVFFYLNAYMLYMFGFDVHVYIFTGSRPKEIKQLMDVPELTCTQIASHLQVLFLSLNL